MKLNLGFLLPVAVIAAGAFTAPAQAQTTQTNPAPSSTQAVPSQPDYASHRQALGLNEDTGSIYTAQNAQYRDANVIYPADYPHYLLSTTADDGNSNLDGLRDIQRPQSLSRPQQLHLLQLSKK